jgi:outer membrane protein assembly factor BamD (BamD/ComL family)
MKHPIFVLTLLALCTGGCAGLLTRGSEELPVPAIKSAEATKLLKEYKYPESVTAFQKIVVEYPNSDWAANSIYSIATAYVSVENPRKDYAQALIHFEEFLYQYPQHEHAADAKNWRQAIKMILDARKENEDAKKENERLLKNIEKLKQLDMRQEQKRLGR